MTDSALRELARWLHQRHARTRTWADEPADTHPHTATAKLPGDPHALRGIPIIGHGIGGTSPGTAPHRAVR